MMHGFLDVADSWMIHYADEAPAFILSNQGYDVWLGNNRGTMYSNKHVNLDAEGSY